MNAFIAALVALVGFTIGDLFVAILARKVRAETAAFLAMSLKLAFYAPFLILFSSELQAVTFSIGAWIVALASIWALTYLAFLKAVEIGNATIVGTIAGTYPAVASLASIAFLGERPSMFHIFLLVSVILAALVIGLPQDWGKSIKPDRANAYAFSAMVGWGLAFGLRKEPISQLDTPHNWFIVQALLTVVMVVFFAVTLLAVPRKDRQLSKALKGKSLQILLVGSVLIAVGEAAESFALDAFHTTPVAIVSLGYAALYAVTSRFVFKDPVAKWQWAAIAYIATAIFSLGVF